MKNIYLDHSATTPLDERVLEAMAPYLIDDFGNPSSIHSAGQKSFLAVKNARENAAIFLNCKPEEVIFTSGATESNNLAVFGLIRALRKKSLKKIHIITSTIEHPAILECYRELEKDDDIEISYISVDRDGIVKIDELKNNIKKETALVSIMYVNNEIGSVQPIEKIGTLIEKTREKRKKSKSDIPIYFHTDAVQAINFFSCDVRKLKVDMLSLSGHKIYGPKGVGALFVGKKIPLMPIQFGGHQEGGLRSGTQNVPGIVGLGEALVLVEGDMKENSEKVKNLRDLLINGIKKNIPNSILNGNLRNISPSHANITFKGVEGESILLDLDFENIAVSTGSACASGSLKASHVLLAMGIPEEEAHGAIRFTLGRNNTENEIKKVIAILPKIVERFRKMAPKL